MYRVEIDDLAKKQVDALPSDTLASYAEAHTFLEVGPWAGEPMNGRNPDGQVRTVAFGRNHEGLLVYLILDDQRRVDVLQVIWLG